MYFITFNCKSPKCIILFITTKYCYVPIVFICIVKKFNILNSFEKVE